MSTVNGDSCKLYRNTGTYATPVWAEIEDVQDLDLTLESDEADATTRGDSGWGTQVPGLKRAAIEFGLLINDHDNADYEAIRDAWLNKTAVEFLCLDGAVATVGNEGLRATMSVFAAPRSEARGQPIALAVRLKPTKAANPPAWYTAS